MDMMTIRQLSVAQRLRDFSIDIRCGEMLGVIGPNGAGKSTLLSAIAGLLDYQGEIHIGATDLAALEPYQRARKVALQPQFIETAWALSVHDVVSLGRLPWGDSDQHIIIDAMRQAEVEALAQRPVDLLSGGEKARVWLARVLANQAQFLLVDEPVANLDLNHQQQAMTLLKSYAQQGHAVVIAIHDLSLAARFCDQLCLVNGGRQVCNGKVEAVLTEVQLTPVFETEVFIDLAAQPPVVLAK